jgi:hypothetical protein
MKCSLVARAVLTLAALLLAVACGPTSDESNGGPHDGGHQLDGTIGQSDTGSGGQSDGTAADNCPDETKVIYVVDDAMRFASFDPKPTPPVLHDIGVLNCPGTGGSHPFAMSIDRNSVAWVVYGSGALYQVDIKTAACTGANFTMGQLGFDLFSMSFVADSPGATTDTLYIAGGTGPGQGTVTLGTIQMPALTVTSLGATLDGWPDVTGTGDAKFWGFFPDTTPPKVAQIDKTNGTQSNIWPLPSLQGEPRAWAFSFWGGDFWVFHMLQGDMDTTVYRVKGTDGSMSVALANTGRTIVGAGVSTCAPITID